MLEVRVNEEDHERFISKAKVQHPNRYLVRAKDLQFCMVSSLLLSTVISKLQEAGLRLVSQLLCAAGSRKTKAAIKKEKTQTKLANKVIEQKTTAGILKCMEGVAAGQSKHVLCTIAVSLAVGLPEE